MNQLSHPSLYAHVTQNPVPSHFFGPWKDRRGAAEESTLRANGYDLFQRVYNDACDEGFVMLSNRTGAVRLFTLAHTEKANGEVLWWEFTNYEGRGCSGPCTRVTVFND